MSKKTLALIIGLVALTAFLLVVALSTKEPQVATDTTPVDDEPTPTPAAQSTLIMEPATLDLSTTATGQQTVDVTIETGENQVTAVQLEIAYDPQVLSNVTIRPATFFTSPTVLLNQTDTATGRISYALGIAPAQDPVSGQGPVATITFSVRPNANAASTEISLLPKSLVTARGIGESVLRESSGVEIMLPTRTTTSQPTQPAVTTPANTVTTAPTQ